MTTVVCQCGEKYSADEHQFGEMITCSRCGRLLAIAPPAMHPTPEPPPLKVTQQMPHSIHRRSHISGSWLVVAIVVAALVSAGSVILYLEMNDRESTEDLASADTAHSVEKSLPAPSGRMETFRIVLGPADVFRYTVGDVDARFGISREAFQKVITEAASVWEKPLGKTLFRLDTLSGQKINLVFDERQERMLEAKRARADIDDDGKSFDQQNEQYETELRVKDELEQQYNADAASLKQRVDRYNAIVTAWNKAGGAPPDQYKDMERERAGIDELNRNLERRLSTLNDLVATVNRLGSSLNERIARHNLAIENYNGRFVPARDFEKGVYNGREIDLYEFDSENDLRITLVHELGHALGFGHVQNPAAVMYYKLEQQDIEHIRLADDDLRLLYTRFRRRN